MTNLTGYWLSEKPTYRLATCCMFDKPPLDKMNMGTTTKTSALSNSRKPLDKAIYNANKLLEQLTYLSTQPEELRYWKISSEIFPCYTVKEINPYYAEIEETLRDILGRAGKLAISSRIRLSSHPGQFTVLGSNRADVVTNSIEDLHYHAQIFKWMGIPAREAIINIHLQGLYGGKHIDGINRFATNYQYLDDYTQKALTVENEDKPNGYDIEHTLELASKIPIRCMLDVHHYYCHRKGESYITHTHPYFKEFLKTWYPIRPAMHKSQSKIGSSRMNEHSDEFHDEFFSSIAVPMLEYTDIECELKNKWTGVQNFYKYVKEEEELIGESLRLKTLN